MSRALKRSSTEDDERKPSADDEEQGEIIDGEINGESETIERSRPKLMKSDSSKRNRADRNAKNIDFYLRYYVGHKGRFGHEFMEFELTQDGKLRYANNSNYKNGQIIRKQANVGPAVIEEVKRIVLDSELFAEDDANWPLPDKEGRQELEIKIGDQHISFTCAKIGSLLNVQESTDPDGLRVFYYLSQDLRCLFMSLISMHFKMKPIP